MTEHKQRPHLAYAISAGEDARIQLDLIDGANGTPSFTGATVSVLFTPEEDTAFTNAGVLNTDPTQRPQAYVDVLDTDTTSMNTPQTVVATITTTFSDATKSVQEFTFDLV